MKKPTDQSVITYTGPEGLKQVTLNSLDADHDGLRLFEIKSMEEFVPQQEAEKIRQEFVNRKIYTKELSNVSYLEPWTDVEELVKTYWRFRYIDPKKFEIKTEILIYNDVVAMYDYREGIFCVEIHNKKLADMQKGLFDYLWNLAETPIIGPGGRTSLM
ncbi:hypothetical protein HY086_04420 [Candidatus Gottesmanbacteria bacterium]|nr:hypothetical protein [Candidatus Gottesmanbacteria bacterium]